MNSNPVKNFIIIISCHLFFIYLFIHFFLKYLFLMDLLSLYKYQLGYWQICDELDRCRVVEEKVGTEAPVSSGTNHLITTNFSLILPCGFSFCSVDSFMGLRENLPRFFFLHWILRGGINSYSTCGPSVWEMIGGKPESVNIPFEWQIKFDDWFFFLSLEHWGSDFWGFSFSFWIVFSFCFIIVSLFLTHWINR